MPVCPECGSNVDPSDRFCPTCGRTLDDLDERDLNERDLDDRDVDDPDGRDRDEVDIDDRDRDDSDLDGDGPVDAESGNGEEAADEGQGPDRVDIPSDAHELDVFEFSFKYPLANGFKPIALAGVLLLGAFLILPALMFAGYQYRVGRSAAVGRSSPSRLEDFWGLAADGFRLFVTVGVAALVVAVVSIGLILAGFETLGFVWNSLASFALAPLTPVFYGTGSVRETYADFRFLRFLGEVKFWIGFAYQLGITFILYIAFFVISIALIFTIVGILAWFPFVLLFVVYATLIQAALWGRIYREAAEAGQIEDVHDPDRIASTW